MPNYLTDLMKDEVGSLFGQIQEGVTKTIQGIEGFLNAVDLWGDYYSPHNTNVDGFFNEVINTSDRGLREAMKQATGLMQGDINVHTLVFESVVHVVSLQENVSRIMSMLDSIQNYSYNSMIVAARSGDEGKSLSAISEKMALLSQKGEELSRFATVKMDDLVASLEKFGKIRDDIESLHENQLTTIDLRVNGLFRSVKEEFSLLSGGIKAEAINVRTAVNSLHTITGTFQHEDIVRQGIEKVNYIEKLGEAEEGNIFISKTGMSEENFRMFIEKIITRKLIDINSDTSQFYTALSQSLTNAEDAVGEISETLSLEQRNKSSSYFALDEFERNLREISDLFRKYEKIICAKKDEMLKFLIDLIKSLSDMRNFFYGIQDISKVFKTILLLTRIELGRNRDLLLELGGALTDVSAIPEQMDLIVEEGLSRFAEVSKSLEESASGYKQRYVEQKTMLVSCENLLDHVRKKGERSRDQFNNIMEEAGSRIHNVLNALSLAQNGIGEYARYVHSFVSERGIIDSGHKICEDYRTELHILSDLFSEGVKTGDYRSMMISSLALEYCGESEKVEGIEFF